MKSPAHFLLFLACLFGFRHSKAQIDYKGFPQWSWHKQDLTEYFLYTPSDAGKNGRYPIVLFLHSCCGEDNHATLRNTVDPPVRMWHNFGANTQKEPAFIIAPATAQGWKQHLQALKKVMDNLVQNHNGDPRRICITGFSMGGEGTWEFLQQYPDYFAAAIPIGMNFHGEHGKIKNIPVWTNRGETDHWANTLHSDVAAIRKANGDAADSNQNWVTGVNPRFTSFSGYGHGVQWVAARTQDLTAWAFEKVNDGNTYPVVFFKAPAHKQSVQKGSVVPLQLQASDPDGFIRKIVVRINGRCLATLSKPPYSTTFAAPAGDALVEATTFDNKGKKTTATTLVRSNIQTQVLTPELPAARQGAYYEKEIAAQGNGTILFSLADGTSAPEGLVLTKNGSLHGVPQKAGTYNMNVSAKDEDGDSTVKHFQLSILDKKRAEILVTDAHNDSGLVFPISKMRIGALTHFDREDDEVTVSNAAGYEGMTYILGNNRDTGRTMPGYLSFDVDDEARVYVAYERKDHLYTSSIPAWLQSWRKNPSGQIVAQYFYYDVYYKDFPKGTVMLPGADEKKNNVGNTYFVLVQKKNAPYRFAPEINTQKLSPAFSATPYKESITVLHGTGSLNFQLVSGALPEGLRLSPHGVLSGTPEAKGTFTFGVQVTDEKGNNAAKNFILPVN